MERNLGGLDRAVRILLGAGLTGAYMGFINLGVNPTSAMGVIVLIAALALLVTGMAGFCPICNMLGINTRGKQAQAEAKKGKRKK